MTYQEAIRYLESFINYEKLADFPYKKSIKLERFKRFLQLLDNPQGKLKCIHIAGTKGKGSTCIFVAYILKEAGFKVGLYTSPHLSDFRERIRILQPQAASRKPQVNVFEGMITKKEIATLAEELKPIVDSYNRKSIYGALTFFEVYTGLAFLYFKDKKVDYVVLETGLGGRLDATNVVNSLVSVITPISYEHTQKLGNTLQEIAAEKAGIINTQYSILNTQYSIVVSAPQEKEAMEVIRNRCKKVGAELYEVGKEIIYKKVKSQNSKGKIKKFEVQGIWDEYTNLKINLLGEHQLVNAATAIGAIEALRYYNIRVSPDSIKRGLYNTLWPGRCEVISRRPLVVLDGAQNIASVKVLKKAIKENFRYRKLILIIGISSDKDIKGICNELRPLASTVILTMASSVRASRPEELTRYFVDKNTYKTNNTKEAMEKALSMSNERDLILVCGSLFVVGEVRDALLSMRRRWNE